ncbi:hypothetical protein [uncultured Chryseobacterium sp.]|uniref:hypothetical protein n=1 Tax=uncultured Chryseobacterium sp. TaxID=259322 RepID=UPI0025EC6973|nr:hypothetical protein [uncultured Chryseobacterium sp.]
MIEKFNSLKLTEDHYLRIAEKYGNNYFNEFIESISKIKNFLTLKEFKILWDDKMQLNKVKFDEKAFIQSACELSVASHFCEKENFKVEVKVNAENKKDIDVQFKSNGFICNIEIKCASFEAKEIVQKTDSYKFQSLGRLNNMNDLISIISNSIDEGLANKGEKLKPHKVLKNMDNNLKDFLESAHQKFNPESDDEELNILLVCCDDPADIQSWVGYLTASEGLFTENSFLDPVNYNNVDIVVFTNLYYKHKDFINKNIANSWNLDQTFNLGLVNPYRKKKKINAIDNFYNELINYNNEINQFEVPGNAPNYVKEAIRVPYFVREFLEKEKGIYLFEKRKI